MNDIEENKKEKMLKIRFQGNEYVLVGDLEGGAIATEEQFVNGICSYAHLFPDGRVVRFQRHIGNKEEIEIIGEVELEMTDEGVFHAITGLGGGW